MEKRFLLFLAAVLILFSSACQSQTATPPVVPQQTEIIEDPGEKSEAPAAQGTRAEEEMPNAPEPQASPTLPLPTIPPGHRIKDDRFLHSDKPRIVAPDTITEDMKILADGNNLFTFDLYPLLQPKDNNFFYSPYSISSVLAMALAGARGETSKQMADIMHLSLPMEQAHPAFNAMETEILSQAKKADGSDEQGFTLNIANSVWGQQNRPYQIEYLDILSENYGAGLYVVDFATQSDGARQTINEWVSERTQEKILDLFPPGSITPMTRLVLANAIYLKANWLYPFNPDLTEPDNFFFLVGGQTKVAMMRNTETYAYKKTAQYEVIELPYQGEGEEMVIVLPIVDEFINIEKRLNADTLKEITSGLEPQKIDLSMPQFHITSSFALRDVLIELGMVNAFAPLTANFSGIDGTRDLYIDKLEHKTFIKVDEFGTEAAAATGATIGLTAMDESPAIPVVINHPFMFVIKDIKTDLILFIGRVLNPVERDRS